MKTQKKLQKARRKMSRVIDEIYKGLSCAECREIELRILREEEGLRLCAGGEFAEEQRCFIERMAELLQPAVRSPAVVEEFWGLAGEDRYISDGELSVVGQMVDDAAVSVQGRRVDLQLFIRF